MTSAECRGTPAGMGKIFGITSDMWLNLTFVAHLKQQKLNPPTDSFVKALTHVLTAVMTAGKTGRVSGA